MEVRPSWPWRAARGWMKPGLPPAEAGHSHCCCEREGQTGAGAARHPGLSLRARVSESVVTWLLGRSCKGRIVAEVSTVDVIVSRCAGLDVHKDTVMACVRTPSPDGGRRSTARRFRTFTASLRELRDWLVAEGVTQVAMEATGVY